jgi:hypothetical protein
MRCTGGQAEPLTHEPGCIVGNPYLRIISGLPIKIEQSRISGCNYAEVILVIASARCWRAERPLASVRFVSSRPR